MLRAPSLKILSWRYVVLQTPTLGILYFERRLLLLLLSNVRTAVLQY